MSLRNIGYVGGHDPDQDDQAPSSSQYRTTDHARKQSQAKPFSKQH